MFISDIKVHTGDNNNNNAIGLQSKLHKLWGTSLHIKKKDNNNDDDDNINSNLTI